MSGGGIMGITIGRLPCSLLLDMEVDGVLEDSVTPFLEAGRDAELLTRSGEPSPRSLDEGIFGNMFSGPGKKKFLEPGQCHRKKDGDCVWPQTFLFISSHLLLLHFLAHCFM